MTTYRVEAHDGTGWSVGVRISPYSSRPEPCSLDSAQQFTTEAKASSLIKKARRFFCGPLRIAKVPADA